MKKNYDYKVEKPKYTMYDFGGAFDHRDSWDGKIKIEYITKRCLIATASARCSRFDITLVKNWVSKDGKDCEYSFVVSNWKDGFGGTLAKWISYSDRNYEMTEQIDNRIDRLSLTFALGKLIEIMEAEG